MGGSQNKAISRLFPLELSIQSIFEADHDGVNCFWPLLPHRVGAFWCEETPFSKEIAWCVAPG